MSAAMLPGIVDIARQAIADDNMGNLTQLAAGLGDCDRKPDNMRRRRLEFFVVGEPKPMGSKSAFVIPGTNRAIITDGGANTPSVKKLKVWKASVCDAARLLCDGRPLDGCLRVKLEFYLERPAGHYGSGKNADRVRVSAPSRPYSKPDVDKLQRQVLDCLTQSGLIRDDSRVVSCSADKYFAVLGQPTGVRVLVEEMA